MEPQNLEIVWKDPQELVPWRNNAKEHPPEQIEELVRQIKKFGWDQPAVITTGNIILKGHGRQLAAIKLKSKIPCVVKKDLSEADEIAIRIADNKVAESRWNNDKLRTDFEFLQGVNYEMALTAFPESAVTLVMTDWESDIAAVNKNKPNLDGIEAIVRVHCPQAMRDRVYSVVMEAIRNAGINGVSVT
jgi:ParB-like chromosome segregation protein Spo0J